MPRFRRVLAPVAAVCCVLAVPAASGVAQARPPRAHSAGVGTDVAGAFAAKIATAGASYLVGQLKAGALGSTGQSVGNFLSDAGLGDPNAALLEEFKAVNAKLVSLQADVNALSGKLDQLGAAVAGGTYSTNVALANKLRSAVLTGDQKLREMVAAPVHERAALAQSFVSYYKRNLEDNQLEFENYLTGGGVAGADGILQLASKRAFSAAQPFYTHPMSMFSREVWHDYAMVQAVWLTEQLNVLHFEHASKAHLEAAVTATEGRLNREWSLIPSNIVFPNTVFDPRTQLLWSWRADTTVCNDIQGNGPYNTCAYAQGHLASRGIFESPFWNAANTEPTNGSPPGGWRRPTLAEVQKLDSGATGAVPAWLNARGGFPAALNGETWVGAKNGNTAQTINQSNGSVATRGIGEKHFSLMAGPTVGAWYGFG